MAIKAREHRSFFEMRREVESFDTSVSEVIRSFKQGRFAGIVSSRNVQRFSHGRRWNHPSASETIEGEMQTISATGDTPFEGIVGGDLNMIPKLISSIVEQLGIAQARMLYQTVSETCDRNGQVVSASELGNAQAFLAMLKKVEFGVDREGNVSMPQIHASPETAKKMLSDLKAQPPEFAEEVERIKAEKGVAALERERERRGRFKKSSEGP